MTRSEIWDRYEMAEYGKVGNTFEAGHAARLQAFFDWLQAAPLPASAALQALIAKWNKKADELPEMAIGLSYSHALRLALRACADELAAALSRADQP